SRHYSPQSSSGCLSRALLGGRRHAPHPQAVLEGRGGGSAPAAVASRKSFVSWTKAYSYPRPPAVRVVRLDDPHPPGTARRFPSRMLTAAQGLLGSVGRARPLDVTGWHRRDGTEVGVNVAAAARTADQAGGTFWGRRARERHGGVRPPEPAVSAHMMPRKGPGLDLNRGSVATRRGGRAAGGPVVVHAPPRSC